MTEFSATVQAKLFVENVTVKPEVAVAVRGIDGAPYTVSDSASKVMAWLALVT